MTRDAFLPGEPAQRGGKYLNMKSLKERKGRMVCFRILTPFVTGFIRFTSEKKPIRVRDIDAFPQDTTWGRDFDGGEQQPRPFWACAIWNHDDKAVQVWEFTQGTVYGQLKTLIDSPRWGIPTAYDLELSSKGEGKETEYSLVPCSKEVLADDALAAWDAVNQSWVGLDALFDGKDPFESFDKAVPF